MAERGRLHRLLEDGRVARNAARRTARAIEERDDVAGVTVIDRDAALAEFRAQSGFGEALDALDGNPLPHTLVVRPASGIAADVEGARQRDGDALPETELVQVDTAWVARLRAMLALAGRLVDFATVLLGLAVAIVVGNTIRLEINNRSVEIEVTKLVGGTDAFIRRPFLYLGPLLRAGRRRRRPGSSSRSACCCSAPRCGPWPRSMAAASPWPGYRCAKAASCCSAGRSWAGPAPASPRPAICAPSSPSRPSSREPEPRR